MGSWNETCAITHTEINGNDEVLLIILDPNKKYSSMWSGPFQYVYGQYPIKHIIFGKYNDYGTVEGYKLPYDIFEMQRIFIKRSAVELMFKKDINVLVDEYNILFNEYIEDQARIKKDEEELDKCLAEQKKLTDEEQAGVDEIALEYMKDLLSKNLNNLSTEKRGLNFLKPENNFIMKIFEWFYILRINPFDLTGCQWDYKETIEKQLQINELTHKILVNSLETKEY